MVGDTNDQYSPIRNAFFDHKHAVQVAAGNEFSVVLCGDGVVYTAGQNRSGSCGREATSNHKLWVRRFLNPGPVPMLPGKRGKRVLSANGCEQLGLITADGELFMAGCNSSGSLGLGHTHNVGSLTRVDAGLRGKVVVTAALSYKHTVLVTSEDEVYAIGLNAQVVVAVARLCAV
jgi:alpha-tubulin suppressor-like RCC1 family protein